MRQRPSSFDYRQLLGLWPRREMFTEGPQLPLPPMLLCSSTASPRYRRSGGEHGKGMARAELDVKPDLWFFACHFKGDPVMPGRLGLDALWQLLGFFLGWPRPLRQRPRARHGRGEVLRPGAADRFRKIVYGVDIKRVMRSKLVLGVSPTAGLGDPTARSSTRRSISRSDCSGRDAAMASGGARAAAVRLQIGPARTNDRLRGRTVARAGAVAARAR